MIGLGWLRWKSLNASLLRASLCSASNKWKPKTSLFALQGLLRSVKEILPRVEWSQSLAYPSHPAVQVFKRVIWFLSAVHHQRTKLLIVWGVKYQHSPLDPLSPSSGSVCTSYKQAFSLKHQVIAKSRHSASISFFFLQVHILLVL